VFLDAIMITIVLQQLSTAVVKETTESTGQ
jgi:hypothetical protein